MTIKKFFEWGKKIEDTFYTTDLHKYLDLTLNDNFEDIYLEKLPHVVIIKIKFVNDDAFYLTHLILNKHNKVICIDVTDTNWYYHEDDLVTMEDIIRVFLSKNNANKIIYGSSDTGPR